MVAENRRARFEYQILETFEAGLVLKGSEVKSIRTGKVNLKDSFGRIEGGQPLLYGMHISPYDFSRHESISPTRVRKLLLGETEIRRLIGRVQEKGLTLIPLKLYFKGNWAKVEMGLAKAKKLWDKRETLKKRTIEKEMRQVWSLRKSR